MNEKGEEIFTFGKHKGKKVDDILNQEPGYYGWILNADFPLYTKKTLKKIKEKKEMKEMKEKMLQLQNKFN